MKRIALLIAAVFVASCAEMTPAPKVVVKDGEIKVPADYKNWPVFLKDVQRPDAKQIRDIYINPVGHKTAKGDKFPNGTISVMENFKAKENPDGTLMKDARGNLVKGDLVRVFVMGKDAGWGDSAPAGLKNGDWVYAGYLADGKTTAPEPTVACRSCHLPMGDKVDYVARYDEYFAKRK